MEITQEFFQAAASIKKGTLVHSKYFQLVDGVHAVVITDPRVDVGVIVKQKVTNIPKLTEIPQYIDVFDKLITGLLRHFEGDHVVSSIFCCVYLDESNKDQTLKQFKARLFKALKLGRALITSQQLYFDEDFISDIAGFNFNDISVEYSKLPDEINKRLQFLEGIVKLISTDIGYDESLANILQWIIDHPSTVDMKDAFDVLRFRKLYPEFPIALANLDVIEGMGKWKKFLSNIKSIAYTLDCGWLELIDNMYRQSSGLCLLSRSYMYRCVVAKFDFSGFLTSMFPTISIPKEIRLEANFAEVLVD